MTNTPVVRCRCDPRLIADLNAVLDSGVPVHLSTWPDGSGSLTCQEKAFAAGIPAALPEPARPGTPSMADHLRIAPSRWAGVFPCWGRKNQEAALRSVSASAAQQPRPGNIELKCFDGAADPYLAVGPLIAPEPGERPVRRQLSRRGIRRSGQLASAQPAARGVRQLPHISARRSRSFKVPRCCATLWTKHSLETMLAVQRGEAELFPDISWRKSWRRPGGGGR